MTYIYIFIIFIFIISELGQKHPIADLQLGVVCVEDIYLQGAGVLQPYS